MHFINITNNSNSLEKDEKNTVNSEIIVCIYYCNSEILDKNVFCSKEKNWWIFKYSNYESHILHNSINCMLFCARDTHTSTECYIGKNPKLLTMYTWSKATHQIWNQSIHLCWEPRKSDGLTDKVIPIYNFKGGITSRDTHWVRV